MLTKAFIHTIQIFIVAVLLVILHTGLGKIDGYYRPVYQDLKVHSSTQLEPGKTEVVYSFRLARNCQYISTTWYIGSRNNALRVRHEVDVNSNDGNKWLELNEVGTYRIVINMNHDDFLQNSFALALHSCYKGFIGNTETVYYSADAIGTPHAD